MYVCSVKMQEKIVLMLHVEVDIEWRISSVESQMRFKVYL